MQVCCSRVLLQHCDPEMVWFHIVTVVCFVSDHNSVLTVGFSSGVFSHFATVCSSSDVHSPCCKMYIVRNVNIKCLYWEVSFENDWHLENLEHWLKNGCDSCSVLHYILTLMIY